MDPIPVLEPRPGTVHGWFDPALPAALTVDPGSTVRLRTLDGFWSTGPYPGGGLAEWPRVPERPADAGHALTGPIAVRGAKAGMVLIVRIDQLIPGAWGTTHAGVHSTAWNERLGIVGEPVVHTWDIDVAAGTARNQFGHTVTMRPFLGVLGMPPAEPGHHSTFPPRWHSGNLDCRELVAGSTVYLPIPVDGALLSVGDGHAAQGDGEVGGTAIECPMELVELTIDVREELFDGHRLTTPVAQTPSGWVTMGVGQDLDEAAAHAMDAMLVLMGSLYGLGRHDAMALASVVVDLRVTQVVNRGVFGVHAVLPPDAVR